MEKSGIKVRLLALLDSLPGNPVKLDMIFHEYETRYKSEMLPSDFELNTSGNIRWKHSLQGKITECRSKGLLISPARGYWQITEDGRQWFRENRSTFSSDWIVPFKHSEAQATFETNLDIAREFQEGSKEDSMLVTFGDFFVPLMRVLDGLPNQAGQSGEVILQFERTYSAQIAPGLYTHKIKVGASAGNITFVGVERNSNSLVMLMRLNTVYGD